MNNQQNDQFDISEVLVAGLSQDQKEREPAVKFLKYLEENRFDEMLLQLCDFLLSNHNNLQAKRMAGVVLKNTIMARNKQRQAFLDNRWLRLNEQLRQEIKVKLIQALTCDEREARIGAAQVIGQLASIEVPRNTWPQLLPNLLELINNLKEIHLLESTVICIGFICDETPEAFEKYINDVIQILTNCISMKEDNNNGEIVSAVRLAGIQALINCMEIIEGILQNPDTAKSLMEVIVGGTQCPDELMRVNSYVCLDKIAELYYLNLGPFVELLFEITIISIDKDSERVSQQAIQMWSTLAVSEATLIDLNQRVPLNERREPLNVIPALLPHITPKLFECLTKQGDAGDTSWGITSAAGACLQSISDLCGDAACNESYKYIQNIKNGDWRLRDAAITMFGSIVSTRISEKVLGSLINEFCGPLLNGLEDQSDHVRDSSAWALGRIFETLPEALSLDFIQAFFEKCIIVLPKIDPRISSLLCWSIHSFMLIVGKNFKDSKSGPLSTIFDKLMGALVETTLRNDADEHQLLASSYEAINALIQGASEDCLNSITMFFPDVLMRLQNAMTHKPRSKDEEELLQESQALLCSSMQFIFMRIDPAIVANESRRIMELLTAVIMSTNFYAHEEAMLAISSLSDCIGNKMIPYLDNLAPILVGALKNVQDSAMNKVAVGTVGSICNSCGYEIMVVSDQIVGNYLSNLQSEELDNSVKPYIISGFGDIAIALQGNFQRYLDYVMAGLLQIADIGDIPQDEETQEFVDAMLFALLEAFTSFLSCLADSNSAGGFYKYLPGVAHVLSCILKLNKPSLDLLAAGVGIIGDVVSTYGTDSKEMLEQDAIGILMKNCSTIQNAQLLQESVAFTQTMIDRVFQNNN